MSPMVLTVEQLVAIMPRCPLDNRETYARHLSAAMAESAITTPLRASAFLAQIAHESGELRWLTEDLNYSAQAIMDVWPKRFRTLASALPYAHAPERLANVVYANRMGNGDAESGDGWKYRGRGALQTTGRDNYQATGKALGIDLEANPERLADADVAFRAAGFFWVSRGLNLMADCGDFLGITKAINGGLTWLQHRNTYYERAKRAFHAV